MFDADAVTTMVDAQSVAGRATLPGGGEAVFTTKALGNLSLAAGLGHQQGRRRRDRLCEALSLQWLCAGPQVHGTTIRRVERVFKRGGEPATEPCDGYVTSVPSVGVMVLVADCLPVVLGVSGAVVVVHAGWRGLASGVLEEGVSALRAQAGVGARASALRAQAVLGARAGVARAASESRGAGEVLAVLGPCAGPCCYEVGEEVLSRFDGEGASWREDGSWTLDLRAIAKRRLLAAGVDRVVEIGGCTICDRRMFSHRREGAAAGRQAAIAWMEG